MYIFRKVLLYALILPLFLGVLTAILDSKINLALLYLYFFFSYVTFECWEYENQLSKEQHFRQEGEQ